MEDIYLKALLVCAELVVFAVTFLLMQKRQQATIERLLDDSAEDRRAIFSLLTLIYRDDTRDAAHALQLFETRWREREGIKSQARGRK